MKRLGLASLLATAALGIHAEPFIDHARVRNVEPQYENVNIPREECSRHWVNERRRTGQQHSYGGAVATGVADRARDRIQRLIYFDACVLGNGESMADVGAPGMADVMLELARLQGEGWRTPSPFSMEQFGVDDPADMAWNARGMAMQPLRTMVEPIKLRRVKTYRSLG